MGETQFLGALVIGLASLAGLFAIFGKIIAKAVKVVTELNSNFVSLKETVSDLNEIIVKQVDHAREGRKKLWTAHEALEKKVNGQDKRIQELETRVRIHHGDKG